MKLNDTSAMLELTASDVCKLLTEAVCTSFSMFEHMEIYRITRTPHGRFRCDLGPNWAARQRAEAARQQREKAKAAA
jgi:hypothetical protein